MMADKMVPSWLTGTWIRSYIRRSSKESSGNNKDVDDDQHFGKPDTSISVRYIQTPWAFVDIRSKSTILSDDDDKEEERREKTMAFAGVTSVSYASDNDEDNNINPLVKWHSCIEKDEPTIDCLSRWREAEKGTPRATQDVGYFKDVSKEVNIANCYHETDPDNTYLEQWVKIDDGGGRFLAAKDIRGKKLLVVAGEYFSYANQEDEVYVSGRIKDGRYDSNWIIETSIDNTMVGKSLVIKGSFQAMKGSTLPIELVWDWLVEY